MKLTFLLLILSAIFCISHGVDCSGSVELYCDEMQTQETTQEDQSLITEKLEKIPNKTMCLCEQYLNGTCTARPGSTLYVRVVSEGSQALADELIKGLNGNCGDVALIMYALKDNALYTATGNASAIVLTRERIVNVTKIAKGSDSAVGAIMTMIDHYHQVLDGNKSSNLGWWRPYLRYIIIAICVGVFGTSVALIGSYLCCKSALLSCLCYTSEYRSVRQREGEPETGFKLEERKVDKLQSI